MDPLDILLVITLGTLAYFLPTLIARHRHHPNQTPILLLNLFLGWTFLGWVGALIWSATATKTTQRSVTP